MIAAALDFVFQPYVKKQVAAILMDLAANSKVQFTLSNLVVTPARLAKVGKKILSGDVSLVYGSRAALPQYDPVKNSFLINTLNFSSPKERGSIIHEGVHAVCDLDTITVMRVDAEAAAFLGQAIYLRCYDPRFSSGAKVEADDTDAGNIAAGAFPLADSIIAGLPISAIELSALRAAILSTETYSEIAGVKTPFNGIPKVKKAKPR
jgi:hypothetical protein